MKLALIALALSLAPGLAGCAACNCAPNHASEEGSLAGGAQGIVRNSEGHPVRARVAAVTESGSVSTGTRDDGTFELTDAVWTKSVVYATTEDDCFAIATGVEPGATGIELVVSQGGAIVVHANQPQDVRCALFQGATRFEDFTLRVGKPARVVVPPGKVRVRLYTPTATIAERELHVEGSTAQDVDLSTAL